MSGKCKINHSADGVMKETMRLRWFKFDSPFTIITSFFWGKGKVTNSHVTKQRLQQAYYCGYCEYMEWRDIEIATEDRS